MDDGTLEDAVSFRNDLVVFIGLDFIYFSPKKSALLFFFFVLKLYFAQENLFSPL